MKKNLLLGLFLCMFMTLFSGCAEKHQTSGWDVDLTSHWQICNECGETVNLGEHKLKFDDFGFAEICKTCGVEIVNWEDYTTVWLYDGSKDNGGIGNPVKFLDYNSNGELTDVITFEYERDNSGNVVKSLEYRNGAFFSECYYVMTDNGNFKEKENIISDGTVTTILYALNSKGESYEASHIFKDTDGSKTVNEANEMGDLIKSTIYEADGTIFNVRSWEYTYNEEGEEVASKEYLDGELSSESTYKYIKEEYTYDNNGQTVIDRYTRSYTDTYTQYWYDGSKTITVYDEDYNILSKTTYDANGNEIN